MSKGPDRPVQRPRPSASTPRSPLARRPQGGQGPDWLDLSATNFMEDR